MGDIKPGWVGRFFEDFEVGDVYRHALGRTVLATDNAWFTLALVTGQSVSDVSLNVMANLGWDEVRLPAPVLEGDTIYAQSEVLDARKSKSRPNVGIVVVETTGFNQDGTVVITFKRTSRAMTARLRFGCQSFQRKEASTDFTTCMCVRRVLRFSAMSMSMLCPLRRVVIW